MENKNDSIIFCGNCGQKVSLKSNFCWKCGSKINRVDEQKEIDKKLDNNISKNLGTIKISEEKDTKPELKIYNKKKSDNIIFKIVILIILTIILGLVVNSPDLSVITNIFKGKFIGKVVNITFPTEKSGWSGLVKSYKENKYIDIQYINKFNKTLGKESRLILKNRKYSITIIADSVNEYFYR